LSILGCKISIVFKVYFQLSVCSELLQFDLPIIFYYSIRRSVFIKVIKFLLSSIVLSIGWSKSACQFRVHSMHSKFNLFHVIIVIIWSRRSCEECSRTILREEPVNSCKKKPSTYYYTCVVECVCLLLSIWIKLCWEEKADGCSNKPYR
jgi:hypothetical protein